METFTIERGETRESDGCSLELDLQRNLITLSAWGDMDLQMQDYTFIPCEQEIDNLIDALKQMRKQLKTAKER